MALPVACRADALEKHGRPDYMPGEDVDEELDR